MNYQPGLHLLATLQSNHTQRLSSYEEFQVLACELISTYQLHNLGEVYHNFTPQGFTAVICLSESHISIHTWPEYNKVNIDIYLSNFQRVNDQTVHHIFEHIVSFFEGHIEHQTELHR